MSFLTTMTVSVHLPGINTHLAPNHHTIHSSPLSNFSSFQYHSSIFHFHSSFFSISKSHSTFSSITNDYSRLLPSPLPLPLSVPAARSQALALCAHSRDLLFRVAPVHFASATCTRPTTRAKRLWKKIYLSKSVTQLSCTMLIPKEDRKKIHQYLFQEGVVVAKKDFNQPKHEEIDTRNLYVIKALQSLTSKGYVQTQFSWQYYYYTLTDEGVEFLRSELNIPEGILPMTRLKGAPASRQRPIAARGPAQRRFGGDSYRKRARD